MGADPAPGRAQQFLAAALALLIPAGLSLAGLLRPTLLDALVLAPQALDRLELWRLWSGHLVHLDAPHLALNLAALAVLLGVAVRLRCSGRMLAAALALMPLLSLGLLAWLPHLAWYAGLSGLLHGLLAWLLVRIGGRTALAGLALLGLKLLWEVRHGPLGAHAFRTVIEAHQLGALGGLLLTLPARLTRSRKTQAGASS